MDNEFTFEKEKRSFSVGNWQPIDMLSEKAICQAFSEKAFEFFIEMNRIGSRGSLTDGALCPGFNCPPATDHPEFFLTDDGEVLLVYHPHKTKRELEQDEKWMNDNNLGHSIVADTTMSWYSPTTSLVIVHLNQVIVE